MGYGGKRGREAVALDVVINVCSRIVTRPSGHLNLFELVLSYHYPPDTALYECILSLKYFKGARRGSRGQSAGLHRGHGFLGGNEGRVERVASPCAPERGILQHSD